MFFLKTFMQQLAGALLIVSAMFAGYLSYRWLQKSPSHERGLFAARSFIQSERGLKSHPHLKSMRVEFPNRADGLKFLAQHPNCCSKVYQVFVDPDAGEHSLIDPFGTFIEVSEDHRSKVIYVPGDVSHQDL